MGSYLRLKLMARKFSELAKQARERYKEKDIDMSVVGTSNTTVTAPPKAKKAPYLRDADGNIYLWTDELAERGDLVAAYDPSEPEKFSEDQSQIALNRELEIAREKAEAEEVARLEAVRNAELAEQAKQEAEEVAKANERNLRIAEEKLQAEREEHAKQLAEMQAKLDALAKENVADKVAEVKEEKKPAPKKRAKKVESTDKVEQSDDELDAFDQ